MMIKARLTGATTLKYKKFLYSGTWLSTSLLWALFTTLLTFLHPKYSTFSPMTIVYLMQAFLLHHLLMIPCSSPQRQLHTIPLVHPIYLSTTLCSIFALTKLGLRGGVGTQGWNYEPPRSILNAIELWRSLVYLKSQVNYKLAHCVYIP